MNGYKIIFQSFYLYSFTLFLLARDISQMNARLKREDYAKQSRKWRVNSRMFGRHNFTVLYTEVIIAEA